MFSGQPVYNSAYRQLAVCTRHARAQALHKAVNDSYLRYQKRLPLRDSLEVLDVTLEVTPSRRIVRRLCITGKVWECIDHKKVDSLNHRRDITSLFPSSRHV